MNNKVPQIDFVFDRRKVSSVTKKGMVEIRITYEKKQKYISTGVSVYQNHWRKHRIVNLPDALERNQILDKLMKDIWEVLLEMLHEGNVDIFQVSARLAKKKEDKLTFLDYCKQRAKVRKYGKSLDNQQRYDRFIKLFGEYGKILDFADVTEESIIAYDKYLNDQGMKPNSKWYNYHRFLNSFILDALKDGHMTRNPYNHIIIDKSQEEMVRHLLPEEFKKIKEVELPTKSLERVRDLFVFQTYTCLSYSDLASFNADNLQKIKGVTVYIDKRQKTRKDFTIPILSPAMEILTKYEGKLPIISNVKYNYYLKVVAQAAGIDKPVSTHWARHTGATMLLNEGIPMQIVSKICGHSSTRITEKIYAKLLDETVVDALSNINI